MTRTYVGRVTKILVVRVWADIDRTVEVSLRVTVRVVVVKEVSRKMLFTVRTLVEYSVCVRVM